MRTTRSTVFMTRLLSWLFFFCVLSFLPTLGREQTEEWKKIAWQFYEGDLDLKPAWTMKLVMTTPDSGWIGAGRVNRDRQEMLYRLHEGKWSVANPFPFSGRRASVLDVDDRGQLWVCDFDNREALTYKGLRITHQQGKTWIQQVVNPGIWPQCMDMLTENTGWIGGNHGKLLHYKKGQWALTTLDQATDNQNIFDIEMVSETEGWAIGTSGLVAHYNGNRWKVLKTPAWIQNLRLQRLSLNSNGVLFIAADQGLIASFDGTRWQRYETGVNVRLLGIAMTHTNDGWAVGEKGTILRFDGSRWQLQPSPTSVCLFEVKMDAHDRGWILGEGIILKAQDGENLFLSNRSGSTRYPMTQHPALKTASLDLNDDGYLDVLSLSSSRLLLFINDRKGGFKEVPLHLGLEDIEKNVGLATFSLGDVDGDGDLDLFLSSERMGRLYMNRGDYHWEASQTSGLFQTIGKNPISNFIDLDNDGDLDLYLSRHHPNTEKNLLLINDGTGHFRNVDDTTERSWRENIMLWGDLNGDNYQDALLVGYSGSEIALLLNDGKGRFEDATNRSALSGSLGEGIHAHGNLVDIDIDGDLDLVILGEEFYLFINDGSARFERNYELFGSIPSDPDMGARLGNVGDFNLDGFPDFLFQRNENGKSDLNLMLSQPGGAYRNRSQQQGLKFITGTSALFSDWDADGDLDVFLTGAKNNQSHFFENFQKPGNSLKVRLQGILSNRLAIGARVRVYEAGHLGDIQYLRGHQQVGGGLNPLATYNLSEIIFGLQPGRAYDLEVLFPGGRRVVKTQALPGNVYKVYEYPVGIRNVLLLMQFLKRTLSRAHLAIEIPGFLLVLALFAGTRKFFVSRIGEPVLFSGWVPWVLVLGAYAFLAASRFAANHPLEKTPLDFWVLTAMAVLVILAMGFTDQKLILLKSNRSLGHFRLFEILGEGGMSMVYRARDLKQGRDVALKVLHPAYGFRDTGRQRFAREAQTMEALDHPNIVKVLETGDIGGRGYISMELLRGQSLRSWAKANGPTSAATALALLTPICEALRFLHDRKIVHRDIKSENIFLLDPTVAKKSQHASMNWEQRVKLMDFGLARSANLASITQTQAVMGTPATMSPEQLRGEKADQRSDIFSLGTTLYEILAGQPPFRAEDPEFLLKEICKGRFPSLPASVPRELEKLIGRMIAPDPRDRFPTVVHLQKALKAVEVGARTHNPGREKGQAEEILTSKSPTRSSDDLEGTARVPSLKPIPLPIGGLETPGSKTALDLVIHHVVHLSGTRRGALVLLNSKGHLCFDRGIDLRNGDSMQNQFPFSRTVVDQALTTGSVAMIENTSSSDLKNRNSILELKLKAVMAVPVKNKGSNLGAIYVDTNHPDHQMNPAKLPVFEAFGTHAALALGSREEGKNLRGNYDLQTGPEATYQNFEGIIYRSAAMSRLCKQIEVVAATDITVLIQGETGTGKELVARAIHNTSPRRDKKWLCLNAAAFPDNLLESELFGHRKGSFSGATEHKAGLFETAHGGTIFLDEIGEASPSLQVRLLRFLETGIFRRVGETKDRSTDVRIIAATNRNLGDENQDTFRKDLFYRLGAFTMELPPLRQRREDIPVLANYFMANYNRRLNKSITHIGRSTLAWMFANPWKGNVRELRNTIYRQMVLSNHHELAKPEQLWQGFESENEPPEAVRDVDLENLKTMAEMERDYMQQVLQATKGNQAQAARLLGIHRNTFRSRLKKAGLLS